MLLSAVAAPLGLRAPAGHARRTTRRTAVSAASVLSSRSGPFLGQASRIPCTIAPRDGRSASHRVAAAEQVDLDSLIGVAPRMDFDEEEDELDGWVMMDILNQETPDFLVNELVWKCLGYKWDAETESWDTTDVFPKWKERFPEPPDVIGVTRTYLPEVDEPVLRANQALVRSIPQEHKQNLKEELKPYGFTGFKMDGLTPNKTRRAQCCNWLLYYKKNLRGKTLEDLKAEQEARKAAREGKETAADRRERPVM